MRQRFSIFNVTANYTFYSGQNDQGRWRRTGNLPTNSYDRSVDMGSGRFCSKASIQRQRQFQTSP